MISSASKLNAVAQLARELAQALALDARINRALACMSQALGYQHVMLLVPSDAPQQLVMLACVGYPGGVGATAPFGRGAIGVCAERQRALRLNNVQRELMLLQATLPTQEASEIPLPGLTGVQSQLAQPLLVDGALVGVLYAEHDRPGYFGAEDSDLVQLVAGLLAPALLEAADSSEDETEPEPAPPSLASRQPLRVRFYEADGSVFFDDDYVIKSLPGRLLFNLLEQLHLQGRHDFTKKELRVSHELGLPAGRDNLDTRLILLRRRLAERFPFVQIVPGARGRFSLILERPVRLERLKGR